MIQLENVSKTFHVAKRNAGFREAAKALIKRQHSTIHALQNVSFTIHKGEMVGYIGPNGAGKSSTIKVMSGVLTPDSGRCNIMGYIPWKQRKEYVRNIGVVFGQRSQLWWDVPVVDSFELIKDIYKIEDRTYKRNLSELTEKLDIAEIIRTPTRQLSLGQRMRCEIAASLLHDPAILFLDEPTIGLDAVSKIAVRQFIQQHNREKGTTVILTTHDMQDVEALTERILLIGKGRILLDGNLQELKKRGSTYRTLTIEYGSQSFAPIEGIALAKHEQGRAVFTVDTGILPVSAAIQALSAQADIQDLAVASTTAEEMVVGLYEEFGI